nr:MAG TPA: hypothetical protein [Caudoviricetes sp.]
MIKSILRHYKKGLNEVKSDEDQIKIGKTHKNLEV